MEAKPVKLALLDLYEGTPNLGMQNIQDIIRQFEKELTCRIFDVRGEVKVPDLSHDIYIFSGGPGNPLVGNESWLAPFHDLIQKIWDHNRSGEAPRKYAFFICHSFQMACHHFGVGSITKRRSKSFGTFPVYKTFDGEDDWLLRELSNPFWVADFREYQVINPNYARLAELGSHLLCIEKEREHAGLERAMMAVRFSPEMIGTQFHPEADPVGMERYFSEKDRVDAILEEFGIERYESMVRDLKNSGKIERTHQLLLPFFLHRSIQGVKRGSPEVA